MALGRILLKQRPVNLEVPARQKVHSPDQGMLPRIRLPLLSEEVFIRSADLKKMPAQAKVLLLPGQVIELHEPDLDLLVPVVSEFPFRPERAHDAGSQLFGSIQHLPVPGRLIVSRGCFHEMSGAVKLVAVDQAFELPLLAY